MTRKESAMVRSDAYAVAFLLFAVVVLFYDLPSGYWRGDDTAILWHAINSKGLSAFYDPSDWQKLSPSNLTPWLTFSFKLDLWLASLSPSFFYIHSLASMAAVVVSAYALNRQWVSPIWACLSAGLFLVGAPTASVMELLMTRHYLEGLLFSILSIIAFVQSLRRQQTSWAIAGALAYALAVTAKEIYVPLVVLVLFIPFAEGSRIRLKQVMPYIVVALIYIFWRMHMLGVMIGGYKETESILSWHSVTGMISVMQRFPEFLFGESWIFPSAVFFIAAGVAAYRRPKTIPAFLALAVGVLAPLVALISFPGISGPDRYLFLLWFALIFTGVASIQVSVSSFSSMPRLWQSIGIASGLMVAGITFFHNAEVKKSRFANHQELDVQGKFIFEADQHQGFIPSPTLLNGYWYVTNLCDIKKKLSLECPDAWIKGIPVDQSIKRLFKFDPDQKTMVDVSDRLQEEQAKIEAVDTTRPLHASITIENGFARWSLGDYNNGQYYFVSQSIGRYMVPKLGSLKTQIKNLALYIQYQSPEGWVTSSPLLVVDENKPLRWNRSP